MRPYLANIEGIKVAMIGTPLLCVRFATLVLLAPILVRQAPSGRPGRIGLLTGLV